MDTVQVDGTLFMQNGTQETNVTAYFVHSSEEVQFKGQVRNWCGPDPNNPSQPDEEDDLRGQG